MLALAPLGCLDTGQEHIRLPLELAGTAVDGPIAGVSGWAIELERAKLAFGPLYLCAGYQAGELCDTARLEWTGSGVVDALRPEPVRHDHVRGVTGPVRSWMYDLGITSLLTRQQPLALAAANELSGNSVVLEGVASRDARALPFRVALAIQQEQGTEVGVPIIRKSSDDPFEHEVTSADAGLLVRFDPRSWVSAIDFEALVEERSCDVAGPPIVCAGDIELTCASDASQQSERSCSELGMVCLRGEGCVERAILAPNSQGERAVRVAVAAGEPPTFEWTSAP